MPGELMHQRGHDGARRAKRWLESTTRVSASWLNTDPAMARRLEFEWPHGGKSFSFDLGGLLSGGEFENQMFVAESKKYSAAWDQGSDYRSYLAKCYVARCHHDRLADQFMWITWHPFNQTTWGELCTPEKVRDSVLTERSRIFGTPDEGSAKQQINDDVLTDVASRLWLLVLSDKQETLVITAEHRAVLAAHRVKAEVS